MTDIKLYSAETDEMVPVTQEWCDNAQLAMSKLSKRNEVIKMISSLNIIQDNGLINELHTILWTKKYGLKVK